MGGLCETIDLYRSRRLQLLASDSITVKVEKRAWRIRMLSSTMWRLVATLTAAPADKMTCHRHARDMS